MELPKKLKEKLNQRVLDNAFRELKHNNQLIDFASNDYLGFAKSEAIFNNAHDFLLNHNLKANGSCGSRLLLGNYPLFNKVEKQLAKHHNSDAALIFNSGYTANLGVIAAIAQRNDVILYDELAHNSIRIGVNNSYAKSYKFQHNNLKDLEVKLSQLASKNTTIFVVTESVFSMDGDIPNLKALVALCKAYNAYVIVDEAHAFGVYNMGLVQQLGIEHAVFARIVTFGKALGCHGAVVLGSKNLINYLINFSSPFIYTTALPPHSLATIKVAYDKLKQSNAVTMLHDNIKHFKSKIEMLQIQHHFIKSTSAIQSCIISGNDKVKFVAQQLQGHGFNVKPILPPTVPKNQERLRFCLHSYNSKAEISQVLELLATFVA